MKIAHGVVVNSTFPGMLSLRGPKGRGEGDSIKEHLMDAGFRAGERVVVILAEDLDYLLDRESRLLSLEDK